MLCFGTMIFWLGRKNYVMKIEKNIIFPESLYIHSNPTMPSYDMALQCIIMFPENVLN